MHGTVRRNRKMPQSTPMTRRSSSRRGRGRSATLVAFFVPLLLLLVLSVYEAQGDFDRTFKVFARYSLIFTGTAGSALSRRLRKELGDSERKK